MGMPAKTAHGNDTCHVPTLVLFNFADFQKGRESEKRKEPSQAMRTQDLGLSCARQNAEKEVARPLPFFLYQLDARAGYKQVSRSNQRCPDHTHSCPLPCANSPHKALLSKPVQVQVWLANGRYRPWRKFGCQALPTHGSPQKPARSPCSLPQCYCPTPQGSSSVTAVQSPVINSTVPPGALFVPRPDTGDAVHLPRETTFLHAAAALGWGAVTG